MEIDNELLSKLQKLVVQKRSKKYYCDKLQISEEYLEELLKELRKEDKEEESKNLISSEETDYKSGNKKITFESNKPLSPKEIEKLAGVDNISTFIDRVWSKSHKNGTWTYSILITTKIKDFYTSEELDLKLKEIFSKQLPNKVISVDLSKFPRLTEKEILEHLRNSPVYFNNKKSKDALFIYIADDHAGINIKDSLHNKEYKGADYATRLLQIVEEVKKLNQSFEKVHVIRLGDELDGYNGKTTRYDHDLGSLSNKEQFDIYTTANKLFYDELFMSGVTDKFIIRNLCNSNHSGNGFAYIANKALEFWIEAKFKNVEIQHQEKFIDIVSYGNHIIGVCHGKDQKHMQTPMPLNLDYRTDLWLMDYFKQYQQEGRFLHLIKGDLHKYSQNIGKFGRYVNVPSIANASNWVEHNFGDSKSGAVLEIYKKDKDSVTSIPIWF